METKIRKIGTSEGMIVPSALLKKLNIQAGDKVNLEEQDGGIFVSSAKPKYTLDELLAKCDPDAPAIEDLKIWDEAKPVGNEVI